MSDELRKAARDAIEGLENTCGNRCNAENNPCWHRELADALRTALAAPMPAAEVTQEQVEAWSKETGISQVVPDFGKWLMVPEIGNLIAFAALAHASGYESGQQAGGRDRDELAAALRELLGCAEAAEEKIEGEWGCGRSLETLEALGELPPEIMRARAILARIDAATTEERGRG